MSVNIIIPDGIYTKRTEYVGSPYFNVIGMYYLSHKYDNICAILSEPYKTDLEKSPHWYVNKDKNDIHKHKTGCVLLPKKITDIPDDQREVSLRWVETKEGGFISVPKPAKKFWKNFSACSQKRFIVLPFGFTCKDSGHANYLLYDRSKGGELERIETYGKISGRCTNPKDLDEKIKKLFQDNLGKDFINEYYEPLSYLPERNFQTLQEAEGEKIENSGFCGAWSIFWVELRLLNPDIERDELAKLALEELKRRKRESGISHTQFIRNFSGMIVKVSHEIKNLYKHKNVDKKSSVNDGKLRSKSFSKSKKKSRSKLRKIQRSKSRKIRRSKSRSKKKSQRP